MKTSLSVFAASMFLAAAPMVSAQDKAQQQPDISYFTKLRIEYSQRPDFNPLWKMDEQRKAVIEAYKAAAAATDPDTADKAFKKVSELSKAWLEKCPVDAEVHFIRGQVLIGLHDISNYASERFFCYGLIQSIASSGDGLTEKTAFKVISPEEEYYLLGDFSAKPTGQSLEGSCDVVRCTLADGKEMTYYFDIGIALAAEAKQPAPKVDTKATPKK